MLMELEKRKVQVLVLARKLRGQIYSLIQDTLAGARTTISDLLRREHTPKDLIVVLILGVLLGVGIKLFATQTFTIGFEDYKLPDTENLYNINELQKTLLEGGGSLAVSRNASGEVCSE